MMTVSKMYVHSPDIDPTCEVITTGQLKRCAPICVETCFVQQFVFFWTVTATASALIAWTLEPNWIAYAAKHLVGTFAFLSLLISLVMLIVFWASGGRRTFSQSVLMRGIIGRFLPVA